MVGTYHNKWAFILGLPAGMPKGALWLGSVVVYGLFRLLNCTSNAGQAKTLVLPNKDETCN